MAAVSLGAALSVHRRHRYVDPSPRFEVFAGVWPPFNAIARLTRRPIHVRCQAHLWLASQSLLMTETEAPTPAQLASLKTEGLSRLYRVVPRWGAKGMVGTMVLGPLLVGAVIGAVGPACSVGAARFYQTAMFSAYGAVLVPGRGAIPIRARLSLKALCHPILRPPSSSFPPVSWRLVRVSMCGTL